MTIIQNMTTKMNEEDTRTDVIRKLNDEFREQFWNSPLGKTFITKSVQALSSKERGELMDKVRSFNNFNEDNDPYGEHDFGKIEMNEQIFFWKIDYYDKNLEYGSENPADPKVTQRVLTIMMAHEY